jgi:Tfp pilus assembly protein PilV
MTKRVRNEAGFTLISVLIAVTMLVIGLMALARTQALLAKTQGSTSVRATALAIAQGHVEVLRSRPPATLATESAVGVDELGQPSPGGRFSRTTVVTTDAPNLRRVTVEVSYPGASRPIELVTLIFGGAP